MTRRVSSYPLRFISAIMSRYNLASICTRGSYVYTSAHLVRPIPSRRGRMFINHATMTFASVICFRSTRPFSLSLAILSPSETIAPHFRFVTVTADSFLVALPNDNSRHSRATHNLHNLPVALYRLFYLALFHRADFRVSSDIKALPPSTVFSSR